ncbi:hypothetical protein ACLOAU_13775 [Niabella sp. CJ426]|uniref:hypothetical protein n=1 Tax=Niabella sp. CJ426 TaxID=3393740 RepID=UPI003CFF2924
MRKRLLPTLFALVIWIPFTGCSWAVLYYATNTLDEPCTIRIKFSDKEHLRYKKEIRYSNIVVKRVNKATYERLNDTLHFKKLDANVIELVLPPKSTAAIDVGGSTSQSMDSIIFTSTQKTMAYSRNSYGKSQKVSGGPFSKFGQSLLYTIK